MAVYKRGKTYWYEFQYLGKRYRGSTETTSKVRAQQTEREHRQKLRDSFRGARPDPLDDLRRNVRDACEAYQQSYAVDHAPRSARWVKQTLAAVVARLGELRVGDLTADRIRAYIERRRDEGLGPRRINMEVENLSRAVGSKWSHLWPKLRKLKQPKHKGRALSSEEERRLRAACLDCESAAGRTAIFLMLSTGMRGAEVRELQWWQIDFAERMIEVGDSKSDAGTGRRIPMNDEVFAVIEAHRDWYVRRFGAAEPSWYLLPAGQRGLKDRSRREDPMKPIGSIRKAWEGMLARSGVRCRPHDLRHSLCTKMAEAGVPESTMLSIMGHMSREMLERYSHVRVEAKRAAMEAVSWSESEGVPTESPTMGESASAVMPVTY